MSAAALEREMTADRDSGTRGSGEIGGLTQIQIRRRISEAAARIAKLDAERYALEELRDGLDARERDLARTAAAVQSACEELRTGIEAKDQRRAEIAAEITSLRRGTTTLERRASDCELRVQDLSREAEDLTSVLYTRREDNAAAEEKLQSVGDAIARVARKLSSAERLRALDDEK
jgi:chromosome segregation ATPase